MCGSVCSCKSFLGFFFFWLLNIPATCLYISQGQICSDGYMCCHIVMQVACQTFYLISHSILTPGQPVPALTIQRQVPGRAATGVPILKSLVWLNPEKFPCRKRESNPGSAALKADALTTGLTRQCERERQDRQMHLKYPKNMFGTIIITKSHGWTPGQRSPSKKYTLFAEAARPAQTIKTADTPSFTFLVLLIFMLQFKVWLV